MKRLMNWAAVIDLFGSDDASTSSVVDVLGDNRPLSRAEVLDLKEKYVRRKKTKTTEAAAAAAARPEDGDEDEVVLVDRAMGRADL